MEDPRNPRMEIESTDTQAALARSPDPLAGLAPRAVDADERRPMREAIVNLVGCWARTNPTAEMADDLLMEVAAVLLRAGDA